MTSSRAPWFVWLSLVVAAATLLNACDMGVRDEHFRSYPEPDASHHGGTGGSSGSGGSGGMDGSVPIDACDCADDDASAPDANAPDANTSTDAGMDSTVLPPPPFTALGLLAETGQCAMDVYAEFETLAELLVQATQANASEPSPAHRVAAQDAFVIAMATWQRAELFSFGPAARSPAAGAQDLRDLIYAFPTNNTCGVDQQIVNQKYAQPTFPSSLVSMRGLFAIEYLLFHDGPNNACRPNAAINTSGSWGALSPTELTQRRADYAHAAATEVLARARALRQAWAPNGGNFIAQWSAPGSGSVYANEHAALTALITAAYYMHDDLKDDKLAIPLSIPLSGVIECVNAPATCPDQLESRWARISADNIRQNLIAFRQIFQGCGHGFYGLGVDDWLRDIDQADLADRILIAIANADAAVNDVGSLEDATSAMPPTRALALHAAIKAITDLIKTELLMVLNVQLPGGGGGDVD